MTRHVRGMVNTLKPITTVVFALDFIPAPTIIAARNNAKNEINIKIPKL